MRPGQHRVDSAGKVLLRGAYVSRARQGCSASPALRCRSTSRLQMNLLNSTGMAAGYTVALDKAGYEHVVVAVKGTFTLPRSGQHPKLADEQAPLVDADLFTGEPGRSATLVECDYVLEKPYFDVLLNGSAYAPGGRSAERIAVGLQVGALRKSFTVWGNRQWRASAVGYAPSAPEPFTRLPISNHNAFGGTDERMRDPAQVRSYLPNPVGRGWHHHVYPELVIGAPVSNTEEIRDPVPRPWRPRSANGVRADRPGMAIANRHAGTYDQDWIDKVFPFLPANFASRYFQCAPEDQPRRICKATSP